MTSRNGLTVDVRKRPSGKTWAYVTTRPDGSPYSFRDQFDMIQAVVWCEVAKYGGDVTDPADWERWGRLPREFILRCFGFGVTYDELQAVFGLPR